MDEESIEEALELLKNEKDAVIVHTHSETATPGGATVNFTEVWIQPVEVAG